MGLRDLFRKLVVNTWQTPPSYASTGGGIRVRPGDRCPCGRGSVYETYSRIYGRFLGCTDYEMVRARAVIMRGSSTGTGCR